jgi:RNA polymerase sigma-70 factor (ECF subfamily)
VLEVWVEMPDADDADLLAASHSDPDAFAVFYRRYERLVAGWLVRQCRRPDLAAELAAEVFAAAYLAAPRFRGGPEPAGAWLLGIARNKLLRSLRRDRTESSARRRLGMERVAVSDESLEALQRLAGEPALELLAALPADQRDAVQARVIEELDYDELASRAHVTETVARKRVSRGLAALRRRMQQGGAR